MVEMRLLKMTGEVNSAKKKNGNNLLDKEQDS